MTRAQLVRLGPLSAKQLKALEEGQRPTTTREELHGLAHACGVPPEFMDGGFSGVQNLYEDLEVIVTALLSQQMDQLRQAAHQLGLELPNDQLPGAAAERPAGRRRASGPAPRPSGNGEDSAQRPATAPSARGRS